MKEWYEGKTVALVGNAESLFHGRFGDDIDSHDVVVRLNKAASLWTKPGATFTHGRRTDVWNIFNIGEYRHRLQDFDPNMKIMHMSKLRQTRVHRNLVDHMFPIEEYEKLQELVGYSNPSTGLMSLYYIDSCNPSLLNVYGFDWKDTPTFTDMERLKDPKCFHDFELERNCCAEYFFTKPTIRNNPVYHQP